MQECRVCGLLFLGGGSCPSCGSQVAVDIVIDDINMDDDSIPGLDDVVNAIGNDNQSLEAESNILPFGMGAKAEVLQSSLPFGVGSFSEGVEEVAIPISEDEIDWSEDEPEVEDHKLDDTIGLMAEPPVELPVETPAEIPVETPAEIPVETPAATQYPDAVAEYNTSVDAEIPTTISQSKETVRLVAEGEGHPPGMDMPDVREEVTAEDLFEATSEDVPEMWRIDAAVVDMDAIYAQDDQIIEVSFEEDLGSGDVEVSFDDFHHLAVEDSMASDDTAPELHPARALSVDTLGQSEIEQMVQLSFTHMGNSSWSQAAQVLSSASTNLPNNSSLLNNLGLALLQSALEMDSMDDPMAASQYEASIMALRQGAKIDAENNTLLLNLAHALLVSGRAEKALGIINVVRSRDSSNIEIENTLGACLIQLGRGKEAHAVLAPHSIDEVVSANLRLI
jgi:tetratricopeptide (TPR) repeat protein